MPDLRSRQSSQRQVSSQLPASLESTEYPASTSTLRRQDARDIFEDFGIDRPSGWLSDDDNAGPNTIDGHKSISKVVRVCHSCAAPLTSRKFCPSCGHSACVKCTSEVQGQHLESEDGDNGTVVQRLGATSAENPDRPMDASQSTQKSVAQPFEIPKESLPDIGSSVAVRNNPFVLADQRAKGAAAKPKLTPTPARPRKATRLSDCVPNQRAVSAHRSVTTSGIHSPRELRQNFHAQHSGRAASGQLDTLEAFPDMEEEPHCQSINSLEKKIDQLYHHAEDLQNTKHILEHLAAGSAANHEHPMSTEDNTSRRSGSHRETSISPSALRAPHRISVDPMIPIGNLQKSHTISKDPAHRVMGWSRPHTLSLDSPSGVVPKARLSETLAWLLHPDKSPGNARESLQQPTNKKGSDRIHRPASSPPMSSGLTTPSKAAHQQAHQDAPHSADKSKTLPWHHKPLRRVEKMSEIPRHALAERSSSPEFRRHQLRKVTQPEPVGSESSQPREIGARKRSGKGCVNCSPDIAHEPSEEAERSVHSSYRGIPAPREGQTMVRPHDPDELFLPYRPKPGREKHHLTVAEVEQALASDSSIGKFSPPPTMEVAQTSVERGDEILSPMPIMPPNHTCSWKDRYMDLTAEVRQLKAEKVLREGSLEQAAESQESLQNFDAGAGEEDVSDDGLGIEGLTIVVHLKGRDDLVVNTDLRDVS